MPFLKHIGKHGDKKVVVLWRKTPGEDHMALILYPEVIQASWHDAIMRVLESDVGQQSENFADALHRNTLPDGRLILETLHRERIIKKIRSADILMTPTPKDSIRLDELNTMLDELAKGEDAYRRMQEQDASRGLVDPKIKRRHEAEFKARNQTTEPEPLPFTAPEGGVLSDRDIAANNLAQAERMEREAKAMIAEASRMKKEAEKLFPSVTVADAKETAPVAEAPAKPKRGTRKKVNNAA